MCPLTFIIHVSNCVAVKTVIHKLTHATHSQALLSSPQPDDPQDAVVAKQYISDRALFESTARCVTFFYVIKQKLYPHTVLWTVNCCSKEAHKQDTACIHTRTSQTHPCLIRRHWTEAFAIPKSEDEVVLRIMEMGFSKDAATNALGVSEHMFLSAAWLMVDALSL